MKRILYINLLLYLCLVSFNAKAERVAFSTGTGFYLTREGHIITNAHVINKCKDQRVFIQKSKEEPEEVTLLAVSDTYDIALLQSSSTPTNIGFLRSENYLPEIGERVMLLGYPEEYAASGQFAIEYSHILSLTGPNGEDKFMLFEPSARRGNSGGPLLDLSGNVIGIITAKLQFFETNPYTSKKALIGASDAAIRLSALEEFLEQEHVQPQYRDASMILSDNYNQQVSSEFIINVLCQKEEKAESQLLNNMQQQNTPYTLQGSPYHE